MNRREFLQASSGAAVGASLLSSAKHATAAAVVEPVPMQDAGALALFVQNKVELDPVHVAAVKRYSDWKFGMFIHWGPYSQLSVEASWPIMTPSKEFPVTQEEYVTAYKTFDPEKFNPDSFVSLAKDTGMRYMVFTTKHHDGFCMFDTSFTDYKITSTPYKKDIVVMLSEAARKQEMPLGLYYSPPDMHHPAFRDTSKPVSENWHGQPERPEWPLYLHYMELELRELLTRYGDVALIWFDGLNDQRKYDGYHIQRAIHDLQPATLINNRIGIAGDFETPEQFLPKSIPVKGHYLDFAHKETGSKPGDVPAREDFRLWETCMTINNTWAYNKNDHNYKSAKMLIQNLVGVASMGGNFLLNVGPGPDGTIQPEFVERLQAIGKWMSVNGESIYGTTYGPLQKLPYGKTTVKGNKVYLHVLDWTGGDLVAESVGFRVREVRSLADKSRVNFSQQGERLVIHTTGSAPDPYASVLELATNL